jgi:hypothetical protein
MYGPISALEGLHTNIATTTGKPTGGSNVQDTDPANYVGTPVQPPPVPELPSGALLALVLTGIGDIIWFTRRSKATAVK